MRVTESAGVIRDGDTYSCPDCYWPYSSQAAAASCDCALDRP